MNQINLHQVWRFSQLCLSSAAFVLAAQLQTVAQTVAVERATGLAASDSAATESSIDGAGTTPLATILTPPLLIPALPPIQPIFPEVTETRLVLRLSARRVYVYRGDELQVSYPVAIGRPGWETPIGSFEVFQMVENPGWTNPFTREVVPPGPRNPLGERWIAFWTDDTNYIGFHGTPNRDSVGRAASHGCIRMYNEDVRALYEMVEVGTPVVVEP
jgi:lipoprotein-anchoring transpeptidase ErfK/SrfK